MPTAAASGARDSQGVKPGALCVACGGEEVEGELLAGTAGDGEHEVPEARGGGVHQGEAGVR